MFSSCRCSPPSFAAPASLHDVRWDRTAKPIASHAASSPRSLPPQSTRPPNASGSSVAPVPPSSPSSPPHEVPGFGSQRSRPVVAFEVCARGWRSREMIAALEPDRRRRSRGRRQGNLLRVPSAETRPSLPIQRRAEGPIVPPLSGESAGRHQGVQVRRSEWMGELSGSYRERTPRSAGQHTGRCDPGTST
jgi:hypothetical protein